MIEISSLSEYAETNIISKKKKKNISTDMSFHVSIIFVKLGMIKKRYVYVLLSTDRKKKKKLKRILLVIVSKWHFL